MQVLKNAIIAIVVVSWTKYARLARSLVMKIRDRDYVSAAIVTGSKTPYMLFRYMLPNALPTLIITAATEYWFHDAGTGGNVLPGIWREAAGTGMGLYAE